MTGPQRAAKRRLCVVVELETDHPRLDPATIDVSTPDATAALRCAVVESLSGLVSVVAVMPVEAAQVMLRAHDAAMREVTGKPGAVRPPPGYVPPHRKRAD